MKESAQISSYHFSRNRGGNCGHYTILEKRTTLRSERKKTPTLEDKAEMRDIFPDNVQQIRKIVI